MPRMNSIVSMYSCSCAPGKYSTALDDVRPPLLSKRRLRRLFNQLALKVLLCPDRWIAASLSAMCARAGAARSRWRPIYCFFEACDGLHERRMRICSSAGFAVSEARQWLSSRIREMQFFPRNGLWRLRDKLAPCDARSQKNLF